MTRFLQFIIHVVHITLEFVITIKTYFWKFALQLDTLRDKACNVYLPSYFQNTSKIRMGYHDPIAWPQDKSISTYPKPDPLHPP